MILSLSTTLFPITLFYYLSFHRLLSSLSHTIPSSPSMASVCLFLPVPTALSPSLNRPVRCSLRSGPLAFGSGRSGQLRFVPFWPVWFSSGLPPLVPVSSDLPPLVPAGFVSASLIPKIK